MINKQNLWFITLFSIILILGIYYVTIDDEDLKTLYSNNKIVEASANAVESDLIVALQIKKDEEVLKEISDYQNVLLSTTATLEEKNNAYEALQTISSKKQEAEKIEKLIMDEYKLESFIKINNDTINIVISSDKHSNSIANNIIRSVQKLYENQKYITVKFE